ncbi:phosphorylase b kinase gamma catalytic chain, skeletal muscle/heart isoform-like [Paramacrobiotus metropolitanus]|uniref:phosphorylase b kinase gamma catalytic chain, skeletal muscle/heart isoform-like n=1 Tax=Paramacrobiotus metropolitanus TaxID=2943436 RepID=UPI0024462D9E|nr:phosphorylase b kinase gamma catalytic chain, skeletal muscle/heart isoform-like [Paramacrobiotus metropolitanus]XP_055339578.1 phosphorylase b kinase gamma catalytic chain, skeletal muscle/heart isoform-like [Paramacrobiotus metropolitanus]
MMGMLDSFHEEHDELPERQQAAEFYAKYQAKEILGRGASSVVRLCVEKDTGREYAVKVIDVNGDVNPDSQEARDIYDAAMKEIQALRLLAGHPNIIELHDVFISPAFLFLVFELCRKGELFDYLNRVVTLSEKKTRIIMQQLLGAVRFIHDRNVVHRDLKPENILMDDELNVKVTDFGFAAMLTDEQQGLTDLCGTPGYLAPEVLRANMYEKQAPYGKPVDLWACGVIMYTLLAGYPPFWHRKQMVMLRHIMEGQYSFASPEWADVGDVPKDLIRRLLTVDPHQRITAAAALQHDFFQIKTHLDVHVAARLRLKRSLLLVRAVTRLRRLRITPQPISRVQVQRDPYKIRVVRKMVDVAAFRMYGHWVHKGEEQNRADLFQNSLKLEMKTLMHSQIKVN